MRLASAAAGCEIVTDRAVPAVAGETIWVAIRPEKFELATSPPADTAVNCMAGRVADIAYLGDVSIYHVRLASGATVRATAANRQRLIERPVTWEDEVWLLWRPDAAIVLKS